MLINFNLNIFYFFIVKLMKMDIFDLKKYKHMNKSRKGIILAGGNGTRLSPITIGTSKQLLPIYNKPMIYYPLSTLMLAGIKEILIITSPETINNFKNLLQDGKQWGISIDYEIQDEPKGIAHGLLVGEKFIKNSPVCLILGDNLFYGNNLINLLKKADKKAKGATIFAHSVSNPERFGVVRFDNDFNAIEIIEKPSKKVSKFAITGLYFYDRKVIDYVKTLTPSKRGELEITDLNNIYIKNKNLDVKIFNRGMTWLDTGTFDSLHEASSLVRTLEHSQNLKICYPEEVAWRKKWISNSEMKNLAKKQSHNNYGKYLLSLINQ